ncbi:glycerol-3-phosphate 1-O-acyltransferase PlsY [Gammaproteobacteria bacterium]|nr:glycerol-3-phosphate 1-O-acyltransferase PlsY [Gammaproteobacteria bacterium]
MNIEVIIFIIISYFLGSISSAVITCRLLNLPDPRTQGSNNPGATNVLRIGGKKAAIITLSGDFLKGFVPVILAKFLSVNSQGLCLIALSVFLGHLYPIFFRFQGGKGVATSFGCIVAISWPVGAALLATWLLIAKVFRVSSVAALVAAVAAPIYTYFLTNKAFAITVLIMSIFLVYRHKKNIKQIIYGKEQKIKSK